VTALSRLAQLAAGSDLSIVLAEKLGLYHPDALGASSIRWAVRPAPAAAAELLEGLALALAAERAGAAPPVEGVLVGV
jgi:hypothetical protein